MARPPVPVDDLRDLELLVRASHPIVALRDEDAERVEVLLQALAHQTGLIYQRWMSGHGLANVDGGVYEHTHGLAGVLAHIATHNVPALFHIVEGGEAFELRALGTLLDRIHHTYERSHGIIVVTGHDIDVSPRWRARVPLLTLRPPTREEYYEFVRGILADLRQRMPIEVLVGPRDVSRLLRHLSGLSFPVVRRVLTQAMVVDGALDPGDLDRVLEAKRELIKRSGVLEYYPAEAGLDDIAGLEHLKTWLASRGQAFLRPEQAEQFGLVPPKGVLLLGVQGCGKSLCAKAVARAWGLPLVRFDPGRLFDKYMGETEKNLRKALDTVERLAPTVLWIDEIEKAFAPGGGEGDGGASQRMFGTLLTWLQEREAPVFVVATSNDVSKLPPELLRKGRFDEIFFVDLPRPDLRAKILELQVRARGRDPDGLDYATLVAASDGFSGAELEQAVVSSLYEAFSQGRELDSALLLAEIENTKPLSVTMAEPIARLRQWARGRTTPADAQAPPTRTPVSNPPK